MEVGRAPSDGRDGTSAAGTSASSSAYSEGVALLDLQVFKTEPCSNSARHDLKRCIYYHKQDRRRPLGRYSSEVCPHGQHKCALDDDCPYAHNRVEEFYHPEKYKTKFCKAFPASVSKCEFGELCAFAHCEEELSIDMLHKMDRDTDFYLFHFKTVWCPFTTPPAGHVRDECVYAHNWQDFRRKPHIYEYDGTT